MKKLVVLSLLAIGASAAHAGKCKSVHADLVEDISDTGCTAPATVCFFGDVDGNHGLRGTTYFASDSVIAGPPTSSDFIAYSGVFEYRLDDGTLIARETGVSNRSVGTPQAGAIASYQQIIDATGDLAGTTGHFWISGRNDGAGHIVTEVRGELCSP